MDSLPKKELTLKDVVQIYRRRRNVVHGTVLVITALMVIYCIVCTRRYEATGIIQVQKESSDMMGLDSLMSGAGDAASDSLTVNIDLQTQANILQSDTLALRTIQALHMEDTYDFKPHRNIITWIFGLFSFSSGGAADPPNAPLELAPQRRINALKIFSANLKVKPVNGTRLIAISYKNPDPKLAAAVVNTLTRALADYTFQTKFDATNQASKWLTDQLGELRKNSEDLQAKVINLERQSGIYTVGAADVQGRELAYSGILDRLQQATQEVTQAEQNRILKGAIAHAAQSGDAEMLSSLAGNSSGGGQVTQNTLAVIQGLRQQEAAEQATLQESRAKFGPSYPRLAEMEGNIAGFERSIKDEVARIKGRAESDYQVAQQAEQLTRNHYADVKKEADVLNDKTIEYAIVRQEAEESRTLYEDLLKRLKEAGVLEGLKSSNITVVDPGRVPAKPVKPNIPLYIAGALAGSWFLGCIAAFVVDTLDNKVKGITDIEESFGERVLGALPVIDRSKSKVPGTQDGLMAVADPKSTYVEALRAIRTAVSLSQSDRPPQVVLITSSIAGEGKSTLSANLAVIVAQGGKRTLIVDTDLRKGLLRQRMNLPPGPGLSNVLTGQVGAAPIHAVASTPNLFALSAGPPPPNPTDLLASDTMRQLLDRWRQEYDFIILDSAPVLPVTDSVTLNGLTDATLLLARSEMTEKAQVRRSFQLLTHGGKHFVGLVLNGLSARDSSYYGYYGYYGYRSNAYGEDHDANS